jgi:hypothetical protein
VRIFVPSLASGFPKERRKPEEELQQLGKVLRNRTCSARELPATEHSDRRPCLCGTDVLDGREQFIEFERFGKKSLGGDLRRPEPTVFRRGDDERWHAQP